MLAFTLFLAQVAGAPQPAPCQAPAAPSLDHAIIAVHDLQSASKAFRAAGFRIKPGRPHANGLLNQHIKFRDGTEIELMTVQGKPGDDMARRYAAMIARGDGGVYVALKVRDIASLEPRARALGLTTRRSASGPWEFLGLDDTAAAVFFTSGNARVNDADSIFRHEPAVMELAEVWLEGGSELNELLSAVGAAACGNVTGIDGRTGQRFGLNRGSIVVVPVRANSRPRVLGAVLATSASVNRTIRPLPEFWIRYRDQP